MSLTDAQFKARMIELCSDWSKDSNDTEDEELLKDACESFITGFVGALTESGNTPDPPPPRIRY